MVHRCWRSPFQRLVISHFGMILLVLSPITGASAQSSFRVRTAENEKIAQGHVAFVDTVRKRIVELDRSGKVVWKWSIPSSVIGQGDIRKAADLEWVSADDSFLLVIPFCGIFRVSRDGKITWRHLTKKVSHDADLLPNGNVLYVFGWDTASDYHAVEVDPKGKTIWSWKAQGKVDDALYRPVPDETPASYTHANAAVRLAGGDTIISLRNFNQVIRISPDGEVNNAWQNIARVHEPTLLSDGTLVASPHGRPPRGNSVIAISSDGERRNIFKNELGILPIRTVELLSNGNYLLTGGEEIVEIDDTGTVLWYVQIYPKTKSSPAAEQKRQPRQKGKRRGRHNAGKGGGGKRVGRASGERGVYKAVWVAAKP